MNSSNRCLNPLLCFLQKKFMRDDWMARDFFIALSFGFLLSSTLVVSLGDVGGKGKGEVWGAWTIIITGIGLDIIFIVLLVGLESRFGIRICSPLNEYLENHVANLSNWALMLLLVLNVIIPWKEESLFPPRNDDQ